jgi:organic hydroperoxide reductase OsmC/OhrA
MSQHRASLSWQRAGGDFLAKEYSRDHIIEFPNGHRMLGSAATSYGGSPEATDPEALFTGALASCHMLTFLSLCAVKGFVVESYEDEAIGTLEKNAEGKMIVSHVLLTPKVGFLGETPDAEQLQMLHERAHKSCFISNSVRSVVDIQPRA